MKTLGPKISRIVELEGEVDLLTEKLVNVKLELNELG